MQELIVNNLNFSIGESAILNGVSFSVKPGEQLGIIGPNGSGKTTLFNCISGFNIPNSGTIEFEGRDITKQPSFRRANLGLGRVFQNFGIFREMTVIENIIIALESKQRGLVLPWSKRHKRNVELAQQHLAEVGLSAKARDKAGSLSGGQMRLLEIIRTIALGSTLLLLDEPTAGVSPKMKSDVEELLFKLHEMGKTVLIIEHDINFIQKLCERIVVLDVGRVVLDDTAEGVRSSELLQEIYFGNSKSKSSNLCRTNK